MDLLALTAFHSLLYRKLHSIDFVESESATQITIFIVKYDEYSIVCPANQIRWLFRINNFFFLNNWHYYICEWCDIILCLFVIICEFLLFFSANYHYCEHENSLSIRITNCIALHIALGFFAKSLAWPFSLFLKWFTNRIPPR